MNRPDSIPGPEPSLPASVVVEIRRRVAKRDRALKIVRQNGYKRIAKDLGTTPRVVGAVAQFRTYKWVRNDIG